MSPLRIPTVNFGPLLAATELAWRARLDELFARKNFILGEQLDAFEREFAAATGARFAIGVGNGTDALSLCLRDAHVTSPKQEAITSALTAPFTGIGIAAAGCSVRFADIDPETLLLDPADVEYRSTRRTSAVVPVLLYGQPVDPRQFRPLVIQDACQAHGVPSLSRLSPYVAYSFYPTKNLGALGDGGAIATNQPSIDRRLRMLRDGGRRGGQISYVMGINSRLDEIQACFLRAFLPNLDAWNTHRRRIAALYDEMLKDCPGVRPVKTSPDSVRHLYVVRVKRRDKLRAHLAQYGIGTGVHYPVPLHLMPAFRDSGLKRGDLPHAEKAAREVLSLPLWPYMPDSAAEEVAGRIRGFAVSSGKTAP